MVLCLEKARRAWIRLPRPLHAALLELRDEHPRPVVFDTSQFVRFERRLSDWHLTEITTGPFGINGETAQVAKLNRLGLAFAKHLQPLSGDQRTLPPLMPLADVLADLPQPVLDWISGPPPIQKHAGGILFETMGVLLLNHRGDAYNPSRLLQLALDELDFRKRGGVVRKDGPISPLLPEGVTEILRRLLDENGVPHKSSGIDGRAIRSVGDTDGAGLVTLNEMYLNPGQPGVMQTELRWFVPNHMKPVARALVDGETDPFKLVLLMPTDYQEWVADGLPINKVPRHPRLLALVGVVKKKGKYDWQFVKDYADLQSRTAAFLRAREYGDVVPDDAPLEGAGVEIVLPDDDGPADLSLDDEFDIMGDAPKIVEADTGGIIEAPVPSNAELAAAKARREARHPVADLSLDDEFDIL